MAVNEIPQPGITQTTEQRDKQLYYSMVGRQVKGGTLLSGQNLATGTVLGRVTASGKYVAYNEAGTDDGRRVAVAVLEAAVDASASDMPCNIVIGGSLRTAALVGLDANGLADLNGRQDTVLGYTKF